MKKLLIVATLALFISDSFCSSNLLAAETVTTVGSGITLIIPQGFLRIDNDEILSISLEAGSDYALFKGKTTQKAGKVKKGDPTPQPPIGGHQGGHMTITEDYCMAGMDEGNAVVFDPATGTLSLVQVTGDELTILDQTSVSAD